MHNSDFISEATAWENIGAVAGGQVGCNYQIRQFVVGVEGEFDWARPHLRAPRLIPLTAKVSLLPTTSMTPLSQCAWATRSIVSWHTASWGPGSGKFDWMRTETDFPGVGCECTSTRSATRTLIGLLFGFGFEYALTDQWTAKLEYNYINYGNATANFTTACSPAINCGGIETSFTNTEREAVQTFKVGVNFKFFLRADQSVEHPLNGRAGHSSNVFGRNA